MKGALMARRVLTPRGEGKPIGMYSAGVEVGEGSLVFVAGQVAMDAEGRIVGEGDIKAQATQVYRNLAAVLAEAGLTLRDVVKLTTFLTRNEDWAPFGEWRRAEYPRLFPDGVYPPNTGVVVHALARPELVLEVEAIAVKPGRQAGAARPAGRRERAAGPPRTRAARTAPARKTRGGRGARRR
jgi:enamine deaminase RidA (YjgF/YER057c/UK114 family)